ARVPKTGIPSTSSSRSIFTQGLQDDGIDARFVAYAVFEIRDAGPCAQRGVPGARDSRLYFFGELTLERQPVLVRRDAEQAVVQRVQPSQFLDRPLVVVDAQVAENVREPGVATVALDDEQRRGLLAALVSACDL